MSTGPELQNTLKCWNIEGQPIPLVRGCIHDTYVVGERYLVQRLNRLVFSNPEVIMRNFQRVESVVGDLVIKPLPNQAGDYWRLDERQCLWRVYPYILSRSFGWLPDELLESASARFGRFLLRLRNVDDEFEVAIPGFHNLNGYLRWLDSVRRTGVADEELRLVDRYREQRVDFGNFQQVIHGDCKVSNLLFDIQTDRVLKVVDLDTLMYGHPAWDFGDLMRSICTKLTHSGSVQELAIARIEKAVSGFFSEFGIAGLSDKDIYAFAIAPAYMSFMLGVRFLSDHFAGDQYFNVFYLGENLERARGQLVLSEQFRSIYGRLADSILGYL